MNSVRVHFLFHTLSQVLLSQFVSRLSFYPEFVSSIFTRDYILFIHKYFESIILKFITDIKVTKKINKIIFALKL